MRTRYMGGAGARKYAYIYGSDAWLSVSTSAMSGEPGQGSRGRGRGRGRGWRGHHGDRWSSAGDVPFPRQPPGAGVEPWPFLQPNHVTSFFPGPPRYLERGRGFVQPPPMAAPFHYPPPPSAHTPLRHPSIPPQRPNTLLWHPNTLPQHPTPRGRYIPHC